MRDNTIGTHGGNPELTPYDPIKNVPGSDLYNEVSGPETAARGRERFTKPGAYSAASTSEVQVGNVFANVRNPSVPRREYIPKVSLSYLEEEEEQQ